MKGGTAKQNLRKLSVTGLPKRPSCYPTKALNGRPLHDSILHYINVFSFLPFLPGKDRSAAVNPLDLKTQNGSNSNTLCELYTVYPL